MIKSGWRTTEFWLAILSNVAALLATIAGVLDGQWAVIVMTIANGLYALSRGFAKGAGGGQ